MSPISYRERGGELKQEKICSHQEPVLQRRPLMIEPGGLEGGGVESGLLKMGIEGGGSLMS